MTQYAIKPDSFWRYKGKRYRISEVKENLLSQNAQGDWEATVIYESELARELKFARPITEFINKFRPY